MNFKEASSIFADLESEKTPELIKYRTEMYRLAVEYAHIRAGWNFLDADEHRASSQSRTLTHNAFIDSCNILSRAIIRQGSGTSEWRRALGDDRREIGDFACYLTCLLGLRAR